MADEMIQEIVTKARHELQLAQEKADNTERPANACPAHDSQFALTKAISGALDTMLMMAQQGVKQGVSSAPEGKLGVIFALLLKPWPWAFASIAVFSPNFLAILETLKGVAK